MLAVAGNARPHARRPVARPGRRRTTAAARSTASVSRHDLDPLLRLFDFPDPNLTSDERPVTTVPLQQLFVLNSEFMVAQRQGAGRARLRRPSDGRRAAHPAGVSRCSTAGRRREREVQLGLEFLTASDADRGDEAS